MTTIRQAHHRQYVSISNTLAQNNSLSLKARGLMVYLLSLPDDWKIRVSHLEKVMLEGRDSILSALKELRLAGYVWHQKVGFKEGWTYWVFENPVSEEEFKKCLRTNGFPNDWENQQLGNPQLQKTHTLHTPKTNTKTLLPPDPPSTPEVCEVESPPTKEEEEEIQALIKNRPQGLPRIKNMRLWKASVLKEIRLKGPASVPTPDSTEKHRKEALAYDMTKVCGFSVYACSDRVEFTQGSQCIQVRYDLLDEDWNRQVLWNRT